MLLSDLLTIAELKVGSLGEVCDSQFKRASSTKKWLSERVWHGFVTERRKEGVEVRGERP